RTSPSDLVQQTFLQAVNQFDQFQGADASQLMAWLRRILVNNIVAAYNQHVLARKRDLRRERPVAGVSRSIDQSSADVEQALADSGARPDARLVHEELAAEVADMLAALPDPQREVIILRNLEGLPFEQIAQRMGRTSAAVRKLWTRAICQLKASQRGRSDG
ncbi:MAG: sigma-70 family RNA polymerase sigma factor, partial [Planctomycetota bacterium]